MSDYFWFEVRLLLIVTVPVMSLLAAYLILVVTDKIEDRLSRRR